MSRERITLNEFAEEADSIGIEKEERRKLFNDTREVSSELVEDFLQMIFRKGNLSVEDAVEVGVYLKDFGTKAEIPQILSPEQKKALSAAIIMIEKWIVAGKTADFEKEDVSYQTYLATLAFVVNQISKVVSVPENGDIEIDVTPLQNLAHKTILEINQAYSQESLNQKRQEIKGTIQEQDKNLLKLEEERLSLQSRSEREVGEIRRKLQTELDNLIRLKHKEGKLIAAILQNFLDSEKFLESLRDKKSSFIQSMPFATDVPYLEKKIEKLSAYFVVAHPEVKEALNFLNIPVVSKDSPETIPLDGELFNINQNIVSVRRRIEQLREIDQKLQHATANLPLILDKIFRSYQEVETELLTNKRGVIYFIKDIIIASEKARKDENDVGIKVQPNPLDWESFPKDNLGSVFTFAKFPTDIFPASVHFQRKYMPFAGAVVNFLHKDK